MCLAHRSKAEMRHTCRGTINLATANITVEDSCNFIISNGGAQTYHLKASSEVERQRWVTALELAKAKAVKMLAESGKRQVKSNRNRAGCGGGAGILKGLLWRKQREVMWKTKQWTCMNYDSCQWKVAEINQSFSSYSIIFNISFLLWFQGWVDGCIDRYIMYILYMAFMYMGWICKN